MPIRLVYLSRQLVAIFISAISVKNVLRVEHWLILRLHHRMASLMCGIDLVSEYDFVGFAASLNSCAVSIYPSLGHGISRESLHLVFFLDT